MARNDHSRTDRSHDHGSGGELSLYDVYLMQERIEGKADKIGRNLDRIFRRLGRLLDLQTIELEMETEMASNVKAQIAELQAEMARDASVTSSAVTLIESVLTAIEENIGNEEELQKLVTGYRGNTDALAAAVAKGTPAEPETGGEAGTQVS